MAYFSSKTLNLQESLDVKKKLIIERLSIAFTANGKREIQGEEFSK